MLSNKHNIVVKVYKYTSISTTVMIGVRGMLSRITGIIPIKAIIRADMFPILSPKPGA
jgi:hypothetical protein